MRKLTQKIVVFLFVFAAMLVFSSCTGKQASQTEAISSSKAPSNTEESTAPQKQSDETSQKSETEKETIMVEITMENGGIMRLELDKEAAPLTTENFISLVKDEFYDGLTFHRILEGFMIQGGDPDGTGMGGADNNIKGEFSSNGWDNSIVHERGVISMARSNDPDSASSQFFIMHENSPHLDGSYAGFGKLVEGFEVLDEIATTKLVGNPSQGSPEQPIVMKTIRIIEE